MIYTTNYNSRSMKEKMNAGNPIVGISRWPYRWNSQIKIYEKDLAPTERLLNDWRDLYEDPSDDMTWEQFCTRYLNTLQKHKVKVIKILKELDAKNSVLCCFEKDCTICHRSLIAKFIERNKLNIEIKEI